MPERSRPDAYDRDPASAGASPGVVHGQRGVATTTVRADQVREGDWVRWPADSDTMRRICEVDLDSESMEARAYSAYDDYEYEWAAHQPVEVWRGA